MSQHGNHLLHSNTTRCYHSAPRECASSSSCTSPSRLTLDAPIHFSQPGHVAFVPKSSRRRRAEVAWKLEGLLRGEKPAQRCEGGRAGCSRRDECRALSTPASHVQATALPCSSLLFPPCARFSLRELDENVWRKRGRASKEAAVSGCCNCTAGWRNKRQHEEAK